MFSSSTISLPAPFAQEHQPFRLNTEPPKPQPVGQCHFLMVQPSAKSKICTCQNFHHNRSAPGNVCDCGHSACYHTHSSSNKVSEDAQSPRFDLIEKIRRLEDMILADRASRDNERIVWQRELRSLRELLSTRQKTDDEVQRKLSQLDDKFDLSLGNQQYLKDRYAALDVSNLTLERRTGSSTVEHGRPRNSNASEDMPGLTPSEERSSTSSFSRHHTPSEGVPAIVEPESPRSSGILNLVNQSRPSIPPYVVPTRQTSTLCTTLDEPRSSGFLGVDMREPFKHRSTRNRQPSASASSATDSTRHGLGTSQHPSSPRADGSHLYQSPAIHSIGSTTSLPRSTPPRSLPRPSPPANGYIGADRVYQEASSSRTARKRKHCATEPGNSRCAETPILALDVLADVSAATGGLR